MAETISVTVTLTVRNVRRFVRAAQDRAVADGVAENRKAARMDYHVHDLCACAQMLIDPGMSPPGCEIEFSTAERA